MSNFRITPIGTCRIHTPLGRAIGRFPIKVDLRRNYGFVHTSDEALQQVRFLQGEKEFRPEVLPLVFRSEHEKAPTENWEPADLHIVEISSGKRITSGPDSVQINFVYRYFADFFANSERARRFWNRLRQGHRQDLVDFLERQRAYQLMSPADRELLLSLSVEQQTFKHVKRDMAEIVERLGRNKVLFVTHVNALTPDGERLPTRDRLIRWVKVAAEQLDVPVFDPTALMMEVGQDAALENGGVDLTHYTGTFSDQVYRAIHREYVAPHLGPEADTGDETSRRIIEIATRVESALELGDFFGGSRELHAAVEEYPEAIDLVRLRGVIRSRIGDHRGAVADLSQASAEIALSDDVRLALLDAAAAIQDDERSLSIAQGLLADDMAGGSVYRIALEAAERLGRTDLAITYAKQVYRRDRTDLTDALHVLDLIAGRGVEAELEEWRSEILENIALSSTGALGLAVWALRHRDEELFSAALKVVAIADKGGAIDLMEDALNAGMTRAIAASVPIAVDLGRLAPELNGRRATLVQAALDAARERFATGDLLDAYALARPITDLAGVQSRQVQTSRLAGEARHLVRDIVAAARERVREAFANGDAAAVIRAGQEVGSILEEDGGTATLLARSLHAEGKTDEALALLRRVGGNAADSFPVLRWTARLAIAAQDYATALEAYDALKQIGGREVVNLRPEMTRFYGSVEPRALKKLTLLSKDGDLENAVRLATAITRYLGPRERVDRELSRMLSALRNRLKHIEEGEDEMEDREAILRQMLQIRPDDLTTLRRLALELMRQSRFAEAAETWGAILDHDPNNDSAQKNRARCATLAQRRASASAAIVDTAA